MGILVRQDCVSNADRLFCIAGLRLFIYVFLFGFVGVCSLRLFFFDLLLWHELGFARPTATVSDMSQARNKSYNGRTTVENL